MGRTPKEVIIFQGTGATSPVLEEVREHFRGNTIRCLTGTKSGVERYIQKEKLPNKDVVILAVGFQKELKELIAIIRACYAITLWPIVYALAVEDPDWRKKLEAI